jgi:3-deoxy-manno-octulosonate cytidylyltransferase (CMP-KDO synthetase)
MNVQGDEPDIDINDIKTLDMKMKSNQSKIGTLAANISSQDIYENENVVKVKIYEPFNKNSFPYAQNFMRVTKNKTNVLHHIGIYCYDVNALEKFISFDQSKNELQNKLEQLRALDNNININVALANKSPIGVDSKEDYLAIKKIMQYK